MSTILPMLRKDLLMVRRWIPLVLILPAFNWLHDSSSAWFTLAMLLAMVITPAVVQSDRPVSGDAFILTRPLTRGGLLGSKLLLIGMPGVLLPVVLQTIVLSKNLPAARLPFAVSMLIIVYSAIVLPPMVLAALTKDTKDYLVLLATVFLLFLVAMHAWSTLGAFPLKVFYLTYPFEMALTEQLRISARMLQIFGLMAAGSLAALYALYIKRNTRMTGAFAAAAALAIGLLIAYESMHARAQMAAALPLPSANLEFLPARAKRELKELRPLHGGKAVQIEISPEIGAESQDPKRVFHILRFKNLSIVDESGKSFSVHAENRGTVPWLQASNVEDFLSSRFGKLTVLNHYFSPLGTKYLLPKDVALTGNVIPRIEGEVFGLLYELQIDRETPAAAPQFVMNRSDCWQYSFARWLGSAKLCSILWEPRFSPLILEDASVTPWSDSPLYAHNRAAPLVYAALNHETKEALLWNVSRNEPDGPDIFDFFEQGRAVLFEGYKPDQPRPGWWRNVQIIRISPRIIHGFIASVSLDNVAILEN